MSLFLNTRTRQAGAILLLFAALGVMCFVWLKPSLHLQLQSSTSGLAQLYFPASDGTVSEQDSSTYALSIGRTQLNAPIRADVKWLRFDPTTNPGIVSVLSPYISTQLSLFNIKLSADNFAPIDSVEEFQPLLSATDGSRGVSGFSFRATSGDPQLKLHLPQQKIILARIASAAIVAAALTLLLYSGYVLLTHFPLMLPIQAVRKYVVDQTNRPQLISLLGVVFIFWFYSLTAYSISIDQEYAAFRVDQSAWVSQGRWLTYFLTTYLLPQPVVPYFPTLILCAALLVSYLLILAAHRLRLSWLTVALFPLFCAFPIWYFIGEFYANILSIAVGQVLVSIALILFMAEEPGARDRRLVARRCALNRVLLCGVLVGLAAGAYQSFLLAFATMAAGCLLWHVVKGKQIGVAQLMRPLVQMMFICFLALLVFIGMDAICKTILNAHAGYIETFNKLDLLISHPGQVISSTLDESWKIYSGSRRVYGLSLWGAGVLVTVGAAGVIWFAVRNPRLAAPVIVLALVAIFAPFALNFVSGGAKTMPYRSMVGVPYVVWLFATMACLIPQRKFSMAVKVALAIALVQLLSVHANYNALRTLTLEHDKTLAAQVYDRIAKAVPEFDRLRDNPVDFYGPKIYHAPFPGVPTSSIGGSFFAWDGGNPDRIIAFMQLLGLEGLSPVTPAQRLELVDEYESMPIWPAEGAVHFYNGTILVKLGPTPGESHVHP